LGGGNRGAKLTEGGLSQFNRGLGTRVGAMSLASEGSRQQTPVLIQMQQQNFSLAMN